MPSPTFQISESVREVDGVSRKLLCPPNVIIWQKTIVFQNLTSKILALTLKKLPLKKTINRTLIVYQDYYLRLQ